MKSPRQRPTNNLTEPGTEALVAEPFLDTSELSMPDPTLVSSTDRPMSERRRRRLADEQADERSQAQTERAAPEPVAAPENAISADAPPVAYEAPPPPVRVQRGDGPAPSGRHAYLIAGVASALWIGGVAAWLAFEVGSGTVELEPLRLAVYALIALAPAGMAIMLAHAVRQGAGLAAETRRARELSEALIAPTALAAQHTGEVVKPVLTW